MFFGYHSKLWIGRDSQRANKSMGGSGNSGRSSSHESSHKNNKVMESSERMHVICRQENFKFSLDLLKLVGKHGDDSQSRKDQQKVTSKQTNSLSGNNLYLNLSFFLGFSGKKRMAHQSSSGHLGHHPTAPGGWCEAMLKKIAAHSVQFSPKNKKNTKTHPKTWSTISGTQHPQEICAFLRVKMVIPKSQPLPRSQNG